MLRFAWLAVLLLPPALAQARPAPAAPAADTWPWYQDFENARSLARDRKLDLLMVFMGPAADGSDAKLEQEVLTKPEFVGAATKVFMLARFDYPKDSSQIPEVLRKQNAWLLTKYPSPRLPMVWLADSAARAYAKIGYVPGGAKAFLAVLEGKRQAQQKAAAALQRALSCRGLERANVLAEALRNLDDDIVATTHFKEMLEIISLDADGSAGLKREFDAIARDVAQRPLLARMQEELGALVVQQKWPELDAQIEAARAQHQYARWAAQCLDFLQGIRKAEGDSDHVAALALFTAALELAPRSELAPQIERHRLQAAAVVEKQQAEAAAKAEAEAKAKAQGKPKGKGKTPLLR